MKTKICTKCNGEGELSTRWDDWRQRQEYIKCSSCNGTGKISDQEKSEN